MAMEDREMRDEDEDTMHRECDKTEMIQQIQACRERTPSNLSEYFASTANLTTT